MDDGQLIDNGEWRVLLSLNQACRATTLLENQGAAGREKKLQTLNLHPLPVRYWAFPRAQKSAMRVRLLQSDLAYYSRAFSATVAKKRGCLELPANLRQAEYHPWQWDEHRNRGRSSLLLRRHLTWSDCWVLGTTQGPEVCGGESTEPSLLHSSVPKTQALVIQGRAPFLGHSFVHATAHLSGSISTEPMRMQRIFCLRK